MTIITIMTSLCFMPRSNEWTLWHWPQFLNPLLGLISCVSCPSDIWQPKPKRRKNARLIKNWNVVRTWTKAFNVVTSLWTWIGWRYPDNVSILQTHWCGEWLSFLDSNDSNASPCSSSTAGKRTRLSAPPEKTLMNPDEPGTSMSSWNLRLWLLCQWQLWKALPLTPFVTTFASLATLLVKLAPVVMSP